MTPHALFVCTAGFLAAGCLTAAVAQLPVPSDLRAMNRTITYAEMKSFLKQVERPPFIQVTEEAQSIEGRSVFLVHLNRGGDKARFRVFFYAQQHGNEVAGKDALLTIVQDLARHPERLPEDVDLYLMPMVNPDGAEAHRRTNGAGADLNRDHLLLAQPETRALYRVARRVMPHLAVDSHEFGRDGEAYGAKGWENWPIITMDALNHPLIPEYLKTAGREAVESAAPVLAAAGHAYTRYTLGGPPPDEEIRPSTPEVDDGRNGMGTLGALSFIIEAGVRHGAEHPQADLGDRVDAYRRLYWHLIGSAAWRARILELSERARREPLPPFTATNAFWANLGGKVVTVRVRKKATGETLEIPTAKAMFDLVVKGSVPTAEGYAIDAAHAEGYIPLLEAQGIRFEILRVPRKRRVERCRMLRIEEPYDELYQRYQDRQIVSRDAAAEEELPAGTVIVSLDQPLGRRAIELLEPCMLYGLYGYPAFRARIAPDGQLPVRRLVHP